MTSHTLQVRYVGDEPWQMYAAGRIPEPATGKPAIVFVHGASHQGGFWEATPDNREGFALAFLDAGYPTWVVDLPGHGRSGRPDDFPKAGLEQAARQVAALATDLGPVILVGHSMGGQVVVRAAAALSPEAKANLRATLLLSPVSPPDLVQDPGRPPIPEDAAFSLSGPMGIGSLCNSDQFPKAAIGDYMKSLVPESPRAMNEFMTPGLAAKVGADVLTGVPALVVGAEQDVLVTPDRSAATAAFLGAQYVLLGRDWGMPGHGHCFMAELGSEAIAARCLDWLGTSATTR